MASNMQMKQYYFLNKMKVNNIYIPGSIWLYYKIYLGPKLADKLLTIQILPIADKLYKHQLIDSCFFIRYNDPDFHIRLRFKTRNNNELLNILTPMWNQLIKEQKISKVVVDTYMQETKRYDRINIELIESIFSVDSYSCILILKQLQLIGADLSNMRWMLSMKMIDGMLNALKYNYMEKYDLISNLATCFKQEFHFTTPDYTKQISKKYRIYLSEIERIMKDDSVSPLIEKLISNREEKLIPLFTKLQLNANNTERIIGSIIHMYMNRWFRTQNRLYEMIIYSFLEKYYKQQLFLESNKTQLIEIGK